MGSKTRRRRHAANSLKELEFEHNMDETYHPQQDVHQEDSQMVPDADTDNMQCDDVERSSAYRSRFESSHNEDQSRDVARSPLPHEIYRNRQNEDGTACNIYNFSPIAVEKRQKLKSQQEEMIELQSSDLLPKLLEMNKNADSLNSIPLLLNKSLSEG